MKTCWCILPNENLNTCLGSINKKIDYINNTITLPLESLHNILKEKEVIVEEFYNELGELTKKTIRTKYNLDLII